MELLSLNEDVLLAIVSFLDSADASSLSRTNHKVYLIGKQQAVRKVYLESTQEARLFCQYVLADAANLLQHVRDLSVMIRPRRGDDLRLLTAVLQGALQLRCLRLNYFADLVCSEPHLTAAVSALPLLQGLVLSGADTGVEEVLAQLRSAPRILGLSLTSQSDPGILLLPPASRCTSSLQKVETLHLAKMSRGNLMVRGSTDASGERFHYAGPQWPSVRHLQLFRGTIPVDTLMHIFVDAFPALETLHLVDPWVADMGPRKIPWQPLRLHHVRVDHIQDCSFFTCDAEGLLVVDVSRAVVRFYVADNFTELISLLAPVSFTLRMLSIDQIGSSLRCLVAHIPSVRLFQMAVNSDAVPFNFFTLPAEDKKVGRFRNAIQSLNALHLFCIVIGTFQMTGDHLMENVSGFKEHFECFPTIRYLAVGVGHEDYLWYRIHRLRGERPVFEELPKDVGERVRLYLWSADADTLRSIHETDVPPSLFM